MGSKPKSSQFLAEQTLGQMKATRKRKTTAGPAQVGSMGRVVAPQEPTGRFVAPQEPTGSFVNPEAEQKLADKRHAKELANLDKRIAKGERAEVDLETRKRMDKIRAARGGGANGALATGKGRLRKTIITGAGGVKENGSGGKRKMILGS